MLAQPSELPVARNIGLSASGLDMAHQAMFLNFGLWEIALFVGGKI